MNFFQQVNPVHRGVGQGQRGSQDWPGRSAVRACPYPKHHSTRVPEDHGMLMIWQVQEWCRQATAPRTSP